jgi:hypothetical protein
MMLQSARFCRFCHHQARQSFDYTPGRQDDQGRASAIPILIKFGTWSGECVVSSPAVP